MNATLLFWVSCSKIGTLSYCACAFETYPSLKQIEGETYD